MHERDAIIILISAVASRRDAEVCTTDDDFDLYAPIVPIRRHVPRARRTPQ